MTKNKTKQHKKLNNHTRKKENGKQRHKFAQKRIP